MANILDNTTSLQNLLNKANDLPDAGAILPELSSPASASEIFSGKEAIDENGEKIVGSFTIDSEIDTQENLVSQIITALEGKGGVTVPAVEIATPSISIDANGKITASATQTAGYVSAGTKSATKQLAFQPAKTITPTKNMQTAVSSGYYTGGDIKVAAIPDTYVQPSGTLNVTANGTHNVKNYESVNVSIAGDSGGNTDINNFIMGTLSNYESSEVTNICSYAFFSYKSLRTIRLPACTSIGTYAFIYCTSLTSANFPVCTTIGSSAFYNCTSLKSANFPACTNIGGSAFYNCKSLTTADFPVCETIGEYTFSWCSSLTTVNFPVCNTIGKYVFGSCSKLISANFPACTSIGFNAFYSCRSLKSVSFPVCTTIGSDAFYNCTSLTSVSFPACTIISNSAFTMCRCLTSISFPVCTTIGSSAFVYCYKLSSLTLGASTICVLANSNAFASTPYGGYKTSFSGTPYIYVPSSLVASYKTATNWVYFSSYFSAIGGQGGNGGSDD